MYAVVRSVHQPKNTTSLSRIHSETSAEHQRWDKFICEKTFFSPPGHIVYLTHPQCQDRFLNFEDRLFRADVPVSKIVIHIMYT